MENICFCYAFWECLLGRVSQLLSAEWFLSPCSACWRSILEKKKKKVRNIVSREQNQGKGLCYVIHWHTRFDFREAKRWQRMGEEREQGLFCLYFIPKQGTFNIKMVVGWIGCAAQTCCLPFPQITLEQEFQFYNQSTSPNQSQCWLGKSLQISSCETVLFCSLPQENLVFWTRLWGEVNSGHSFQIIENHWVNLSIWF